MSTRFLMIALDGADGVLLDRWSADGTLPNLASLRQRGSVTRLHAPEGITDDGLWASFQYAAALGEHGRYHWRQRLRSGQMGMSYLDEADRTSFWTRLSDEGFRVAVFDIPKCGPPKPLNGIHLVDWLVHGRYFKKPVSFPESLAAEVISRYGPAPPSRCDYDVSPLSESEIEEVVSNLRTSIFRKRAAGLRYVSAERWDLFMIGFKEAHCACHHLWDLADAEHPLHRPELNDRLGQPLKVIFRDLDAAVGALIEAAGKDAAIVVFSPSNFERNSTLAHLMPEIVRRINRELGESALDRLIHGLSRGRVRSVCELLPYNENGTALRLNLKNARPGRGMSDDSYRLNRMDAIAALVRELKDADTGSPVVVAVDRPSIDCPGSRSAWLPDLLVRYSPGICPEAVTSARLGRIEAPRPALRPGDHASGGIIFHSEEAGHSVQAVEDIAAHMVYGLGGSVTGRAFPVPH